MYYCTAAIKNSNRYCRNRAFKNIHLCFAHGRKYVQNLLKCDNINVNLARSANELHYQIEILLTDPFFIDSNGYNGIHRAIINDDQLRLERYIQNGISANMFNSLISVSPLFFAISENRSPTMIYTLLKAGADPNYMKYFDLLSRTSLEYILMKNTYDHRVLKMLLKFEANPFIGYIKNYLHHLKFITSDVKMNLLLIAFIWDDNKCIEWRNSIISRFINRLPNNMVKNKSALFDAFWESNVFELSHVLSIQEA
jgi:hypothetical protein